MAVTVDYRCRTCGSSVERLVPSPPAASIPCGTCGGTARRAWGPMAVGGRTHQPSIEPATGSTGPLCRTNQDIPGLCSFSPTAARALVARARKDNRALERELAYQEHMQKESPGTLTVGGHSHTQGSLGTPAPGAATGSQERQHTH